jgi:hypothetical protein
MNNVSEINIGQLFDQLRLLFQLEPYGKADRRRLQAALEYWERNRSGHDDRKLAYALAAIHHRQLEAAAATVSQFKRIKDHLVAVFRYRKFRPLSRPRAALSLRLLHKYFEIEKDVWSKVKLTDGKSAGGNPTFDLADRFYTALAAIRPVPLKTVLIEEVKRLRKDHSISDDIDLESVFHLLHESQMSALCFSGGGIRSATFGLGIVQGLAEGGLLRKFDYLSTVSGGGYLGSWLSAWILREKINELTRRWNKNNDAAQIIATGKDLIEEGSGEFDLTQSLDKHRVRELGVDIVERKLSQPKIDATANPEPTQLQHLREYSNYMSPRVGLLSADTWTLITIYLRNLFLNLTIFIPLMAAALMLPRFLFPLTTVSIPSEALAWSVLILAIIAGSYALFFVISRLPSKNARTGRTHFSERVPSQPADNGNAQHTTESAEKVLAADDGLLEEEDKHTDVGVLIRGVLPLVVAAFCAMTLWSWNIRTDRALFGYFDLFGMDVKAHPNYAAVYTMIGSGLAFVVALGILVWKKKADVLSGLAAFISAVVGGLLVWLVVVKMVNPAGVSARLGETFGAGFELYEWQIYFCLALPLFMALTLIVAAIFVGLTSGKMTDADREWLARYGGWVLIVSVVWILANSLVLLGPSLLSAIFRVKWADLTFTSAIAPTLVSLTGVLSGIISLLGGFSEKSSARVEPPKSRTSRVLAVVPKVAAVIFLGFIFVGLASLTTLLIYAVGNFLWDGTPGAFGASPSHVAVLMSSPPLYLSAVLLGLCVVGVVMACFVNVNKFSLHGAYRDRLVRAYLGASNPERNTNSFTGFDESDNFQLHRLKDQKPLHIINATLNLIGGKTLAWQNRKAASFTMSPLHCGSPVLGYRPSNEYCRNEKLGQCADRDACNMSPPCPLRADGKPDCRMPGKAIRLGTAMAISGAAANPNMGYYSSPVVTFLMSLFNIRLGWWLGNTNEKGARLDTWDRPFYSKSSPTVAVLPLLNETLGRTDENKRFINVTDGGHFENLALYEMVLRRCRLIVLSDGAADAEFKFGEIANAIQKCKVDLGVKIEFKTAMNIYGRYSKEEGVLKKARFAIAEIVYPELDKNRRRRRGWLLYTRPTYYGTTEPRDIRYYADANETFPHQSTGDQMYDEQQFEAYRSLGLLTLSEIHRTFSATSKGDPHDEVDDGLEALFASDKDMRDTIFEFFGFRDSGSFKPRPRKENADDQFWQKDLKSLAKTIRRSSRT